MTYWILSFLLFILSQNLAVLQLEHVQSEASDIVILQSFIIEIFLPLVGSICEEKDLVMTCGCPFWKPFMLFCLVRFYLSIQLIQWNYCVMLINS